MKELFSGFRERYFLSLYYPCKNEEITNAAPWSRIDL